MAGSIKFLLQVAFGLGVFSLWLTFSVLLRRRVMQIRQQQRRREHAQQLELVRAEEALARARAAALHQ